ncbi:MAG: amidohydrolase [Trueperaceae bacterium]|nr:MAG: amidohydrolase [Trueperaceae bacterium]
MNYPIHADTLFRNGTVITIDRARPRAEAVAIANGRILAVGTVTELDTLVGPKTRVVELDGRTLIPGFHDAHDHMIGFGLQLQMVPTNASATRTIDAIVESLGRRADETPAGAWVRGAGYDDNKLAPSRHPTRADLDRASTDHPIFLRHTSGHMAVVNSCALALIGVNAGTPDPDGGRIVRDQAGNPTGLLLETAMHLVTKRFHPHPHTELVEALAAANDVYVREGITSHTEAGIGYLSDLEAIAYREAVDTGRLKVRSTLMVRAESLERLQGSGDEEGFALTLGVGTGWGDDRLRLGAVKMFSDGSLIGQTAAMSEGYVGAPDNQGLFTTPRETLRDWILRAHRSGWQCAVHAIGDIAVSFILDCYEEALQDAPRADHRHRIEHCAITRPETLERIARLGVVPVPQQRFIGELGDGFLRVLGRERVRWCYVQRSYLDHGIELPGSSDRYVVRGTPLLGIHDAVNQVTDAGEPFSPEEALTADEALRAFTLGSAFASFDERNKGSIEAGKLADVVVLDADPTRVDPRSIRDISVVLTMIGGEIVFEGEA